MNSDVEQQEEFSYSGVPNNTFKERILEFLDQYFGSLKLYLYSYPMPDALWDNRKLRLKASGVQVDDLPQIDPIVDRIIQIVQRQPAE